MKKEPKEEKDVEPTPTTSKQGSDNGVEKKKPVKRRRRRKGHPDEECKR